MNTSALRFALAFSALAVCASAFGAGSYSEPQARARQFLTENLADIRIIHTIASEPPKDRDEASGNHQARFSNLVEASAWAYAMKVRHESLHDGDFIIVADPARAFVRKSEPTPSGTRHFFRIPVLVTQLGVERIADDEPRAWIEASVEMSADGASLGDMNIAPNSASSLARARPSL